MDRYCARGSSVLFAALAACSPPTSKTPAARPTANAGERLYEANCAPCHQPDARGVAGVYPRLIGSPVVLGDPVELARWVIQGQRPASVPAGRYPTMMAQFGWLKPPQAAALFTYLRSHFGNSAPAIDAAAVARALEPMP